MSFEQTPLHSTRRLDHHTFLNKPPSNGPRDPKPLPTTAATYGHAESVSPRRVLDDDAPALDRFARLKQEQAARPGAPKTITSPLKPQRWDIKDTSVNIAGAFNTAVNSALTSMNTPNDSWLSSASQRTLASLNRSTSVEYETSSAHAKRLTVSGRPGPSSSRPPVTRKPVSKSGSFTNGVPDSEGEEEQQPSRTERGKSPIQDIVNHAAGLYRTASFFMKAKATGPGELREKEPSYDYLEEQREYDNQSSSSHRRINTAAHKKNRMSEDNRAYKPVLDEETDEEDDESDGKARRRRKKKKNEPAGAMNNLPVIGAEKRKKRKSKAKKGTTGEAEGEVEEPSESDDENGEHQSAQQRASVRPESQPPQRHQSLPLEIPTPDDDAPDISIDIEQGLHSIPEADEDDLDARDERDKPQQERRVSRRSVSRAPSSRIGGPLGQFVNFFIRKLFQLVIWAWKLFSSIFYFSGQLVGHVYDILFRRPLSWASQARGGAESWTKLLFIGLLFSGLYTWREPLLQHVSLSRLGGNTPVYHAPEVPAANIAELAARLQAIETALAGLSMETERGRLRAESEGRTQSELVGRLGVLETKVGAESRKVAEAEARVRQASRETLGLVRQEIEVLQAQVQATQQHQQPPSRGVETPSGEEARARVKALEERVEGVEGGIKEALELGKKATSNTSPGPGAVWWDKLASGSAAKSGLTIKSSDGQDVTSLIGHLVDTAVSTYDKDTIARPDYALHSGGARVIPSLTSPTFEMNPSTLRGSILGFITGNGYAVGRPPVWALHHELHNGHCWPFAGPSGQLGVALAAPIYIDNVTIDHVASEVAFDMRSAPRAMELWGLVEGQDNLEKVREWTMEKRRQREQARENGEEVVEEPEEPDTLPHAQYIRIAEFAYDIHSPRNVQTFPVDPDVRALGVDFGVVVLIMKSNWGREYTCLYRLRVHGQRIGELLPSSPEEEL